jgi:hypothetical protein
MFQVQLVNKVVEWERRLQMEKERQDNLKGKPYEKFSAASTSSWKERIPNIARRFRRAEQPASYSAYDPHGETEFS